MIISDIENIQLPIQVKYQNKSVELKQIVGNIATIRIKHAAYYLDFDKTCYLSELEVYPAHVHNIDSFNKCCRICGQCFA